MKNKRACQDATEWYLHVIVSAEDHTKAHVDDTQNHRHLHLVGVQKREPVGCQVPNLCN